MKLSTTREAIHDALCWGWQQKNSGLTEYLEYLTQVEKSKRPNNAVLDLVEAAYICAAVDSLAPHISGWLKFAYSPEPANIIQSILAAKLKGELFVTSTARKHERHFKLAECSLEDFRLRVHMSRDLPIVAYAERMGVDADNWSRDWSERQDKCLDVIRGWDREGVGQVSRMVKSLRGDDDEGERPSEILEELAK